MAVGTRPQNVRYLVLWLDAPVLPESVHIHNVRIAGSHHILNSDSDLTLAESGTGSVQETSELVLGYKPVSDVPVTFSSDNLLQDHDRVDAAHASQTDEAKRVDQVCRLHVAAQPADV